MRIENANFLITGSNRGIGRAVAIEAARRKARLILLNRSIDKDLTDELHAMGAASVEQWQIDLSSKANIEGFLTKNPQLKPDILFNNSGQLTGGLLEEQSLDEIYSMFQVNVNALVHLTHHFLPGMLQRGKGLIVNHASVSSIMHFPCATTYSASKAAVLAFSECLKAELRGTPVRVLVLVTPGIKTRMFDAIERQYGQHLDTSAISSIPADEYAIKVCQAIEEDKETLLPKGFTGAGLFMARHTPSVFRKLVGSRFQRMGRSAT